MSSPPSLSGKLLFVSSWFCPFAQRTWLALNEKRADYTYFELSLKDPATNQWYQLGEKPKWFVELNPLGKVPVLAYKESTTTHSVYESNICNEFLEDYLPKDQPLLPAHPAAKAKVRIIIESFSSQFVPLFYRILLRQDAESQQEAAEGMRAALRKLEHAIDPTGPFFSGKQMTLVDCALLPWFLRMYVLEHYRGFSIPSDCPHLARWTKDMEQLPAVKETQKAPDTHGSYSDQLLFHYQRYADATAKSTSAQDFK